MVAALVGVVAAMVPMIAEDGPVVCRAAFPFDSSSARTVVNYSKVPYYPWCPRLVHRHNNMPISPCRYSSPVPYSSLFLLTLPHLLNIMYSQLAFLISIGDTANNLPSEVTRSVATAKQNLHLVPAPVNKPLPSLERHARTHARTTLPCDHETLPEKVRIEAGNSILRRPHHCILPPTTTYTPPKLPRRMFGG